MKHRGALRAFLCLLLILPSACAPPEDALSPSVCALPEDAPPFSASPEDAPLSPAICRRPQAEVVFLEAEPSALLASGDFRGMDLRDMDLTEAADRLFDADFDANTQWPEALPEGFDPVRLLELGKEPGLGLRVLHERGITGKGVGVAIIDQTLLVEHREYAARLRLYQEYHSAAVNSASTHGPAVASIALGETAGAAPEALLYFIADDFGPGEKDMGHYAQDVDRLTALNKTLPQGERIRVISMSVGWMLDTPGAEALEAAVARAREAGIAVICVNSRDPLLEPWMGMGREPYGDANTLSDCRPGTFWEELLYSGKFRGADGSLLLVPMDRRTLASPAGEDVYAHFAEGGMSWVCPYVAGLYALACQVKPEVTYEEFLVAARSTARPVSVQRDGTEYPYGGVVDPAALLEALN